MSRAPGLIVTGLAGWSSAAILIDGAARPVHPSIVALIIACTLAGIVCFAALFTRRHW